MTLRDFILTVREWPWQHLQFFRCFEAKIVKELFGFWPIAETAKRKEIKKRWLKQCRRLYSFAKSASASASNLLVTCRDVSPPSRPSSNLLSTTFISIRSKSSHCFYKHCNYFGNSPFHCYGTWTLSIWIRGPYLWKRFACPLALYSHFEGLSRPPPDPWNGPNASTRMFGAWMHGRDSEGERSRFV